MTDPRKIVALGTLLTVLAVGCSGALDPQTPPGVTGDGTGTAGRGTDRERFPQGRAEQFELIDIGDTVGRVVDHPAFDGFGQFILPLDGGSWDEAMPLDRVGSLLPYHSNIEPQAVVDTMNEVINEVSKGQPVFYDFYTAEQVRQDPSKESTGLFFFRGDPGAPFAIVAPGGGFSYVGSVHEGFPYAVELSRQGYNVFVLQYRVGGEQIACEDLAAALGYIFENAETLDVDTEGYSLWGSSAGARMAARLGSHGAHAYGGPSIPRAATVVMAYTGHSDYTSDDPSTFALVGEHDAIVSPATMRQRVDHLRVAGVDAEFHEYPDLGHGFGLGTGTSAEGWLDTAAVFWNDHG